MSDKTDKHMIQELKETLKEKKPGEPVKNSYGISNGLEFP